MSVISFRKSQREGARLVISLSGVSGSGKTYTALQLAYGLANEDASKIFFIDSENRRGSLYADSLPEPFNIGDLFAPFSPARYIESIKAASDAGAEVIVIDSISHAWEGIGGCQDIANASRFPDWKTAKAQWKRMMDTMLQCPAHVICCVRAREKVDFSDPKNPKQLGLQPIIEGNAPFEFTASFMMHDMGKRQDILKCPDDLKGLFPGDQYIGVQQGKKLRAWVDGAKQMNPKVEAFRNRLQMLTAEGEGKIKDAWGKTPDDIKKALGPGFFEGLIASAAAYSQIAPTESEPSIVADLNAKIEDPDDDAEPHF